MISVITPTVRPKGLELLDKCLSRQTFKDFEWIIVGPKKYHAEIKEVVKKIKYKLLADPPKKQGDFWTLCKGWNKAYQEAKGELIVNIQDMLWFPPDTLERFWQHYLDKPTALVTITGNHYLDLDERGEPTNMNWTDPRKRNDMGSFYEVTFPDMEMCVCSIPKKAILDCGGIDEEYDKGNGVQEKEMCMRLTHLGYQMFIDQNMEYKALQHPRLTEDWDKFYWEVTAPLFKRHGKEFLEGKRKLNVGYVT